MSGAEIAALVGTIINSILLLFIGSFVSDLLKRVQKIDDRTFIKATTKNERITLLEAFDAELQRELAKVILQVATLEQDLGKRLYKLRRTIHTTRMENNRLRRSIDSGEESRERSINQLEKAQEQIGKIAKILEQQKTRLGKVEKIVLGDDYIMLKGKKDG